MWWRVSIAVFVGFLVFAGRLGQFWKIGFFKKLFIFLCFKTKLEPTEQGGHFLLGLVALPMLRFLCDFFHIRIEIFLRNDFWVFLLAALICGFIKEMLDVWLSGNWDKRDSFVDVGFWLLGGLVAPALGFYFK